MAANMQAEVEAFHKRPLEKRYVVIYADATYLNVRRECVDKETLHVLLGITSDGKKDTRKRITRVVGSIFVGMS